MGTRAVITFLDNHNFEDSFSVYQHWDGNPRIVLASIEAAKQCAWELPRYQAADFAAAYVRVTKNEGGNIYLTRSAEDHGDLSYRYEVRCVTGVLEVKSFKAAGEAPNGSQLWHSVGETA